MRARRAYSDTRCVSGLIMIGTPRETDDASMRFNANAQNQQTGCVVSCGSTKTQTTESVHAGKRESAITEIGKSTETALEF